jgi:hypothetical protein
MSASDAGEVSATPDSTTEKFRLIWDIIGRWPARQNQPDVRRLAHILHPICTYPDSGSWQLFDTKRPGRIREQLDALIKPLQEAVSAAVALDDDTEYELTRAGLPQGEDDNPNFAQWLREPLQWAETARAAYHPKRGQPKKLAIQELAIDVRQLYSEVTGEAPVSYKKSYDDQPPTPFENAVIEIFAVHGIRRAEALRAAQSACRARKAKSRV